MEGEAVELSSMAVRSSASCSCSTGERRGEKQWRSPIEWPAKVREVGCLPVVRVGLTRHWHHSPLTASTTALSPSHGRSASALRPGTRRVLARARPRDTAPAWKALKARRLTSCKGPGNVTTLGHEGVVGEGEGGEGEGEGMVGEGTEGEGEGVW